MAISADRLSGVNGSLAVKAPVRVATTGNITLSGLQTIDGVSVAEGNRVLAWLQTDPVENGIYVASSSGWVRSPDFNGSGDFVQGTRIVVNEGATYSGYEFILTTASPAIGGGLAFSLKSLARTPQTLSGDGVTTSFVMTPLVESEHNIDVYITGVYQQKNSYSVSSQNIIFSEAPPTGSNNIEIISFVSTIS